jgi:hypothetical protein
VAPLLLLQSVVLSVQVMVLLLQLVVLPLQVVLLSSSAGDVPHPPLQL